MDIDRNNFKANYKRLVQLIENSDFISFDCEFSGISTDHFQKIRKYDSDEDIYQKMKHTVQNYHLLQIGLCIYIFSKSENKYIAYPFNIYLNPNYSIQADSIKKQMLQLECYNFMAANGLDFNKIYSHGLSYIKLSEREKMIETIKPKQHSGIGLSAQNQGHLNEILRLAREFESDSNAKELLVECHTVYLTSKILKKQLAEKLLDGKTLSLEKGTTETSIYLRKRKTLQFKKNQNFMEGEEDSAINKGCLGYPELSSKEEQEVDLLGFSLIVEAIIKVKRPIIGHYMGLDMFYFYDHFVDHLPNTFIEFVAKMKEVFPYAVDTKVLAKKIQTKIKRLPLHLEGLYKSVVYDEKCLKMYHNTILTKEPSFSKYSKEGLMHEAGFDAYITGVAFVGMCYFEQLENEAEIQLKDIPQRTKKGMISQEYENKHNQLLKKVLSSFLDPSFPAQNMNQIYLRSGGTFEFDLEQQTKRSAFDINHNKDFVGTTLFVEFASTVLYADIAQHFTKYGDVEITLIDNGLCYVEYEQFNIFEGIEDKISHIIPLLSNEVFKVSPYIERKRFVAFTYWK